MGTEQVYLKIANTKLISFKKLEDGRIIGTGILNPLINKLRLFTMLYLQSKLYRNYNNLARYKGMMVTNTFAPPVGSRAQLRALKGLIKSHILGKPFPLAITFAVTYDCMCNCVHCSAGKHYREGVPYLSTEEAKDLIDQAQKLGMSIIAFTGGEPLIRKDLFELISYVNKKKTMPIMFTNGLLLTDENVDKLVDAGLYSIFVSIDSPIPEEHNRLRGMPGIFEQAIKGIKRLKSKGVLVGLSSYATRSATEKGMYKKIHELGKELGVHNIILFDGVPTGNMLKDTSELLTQSLHEEIHAYSAKIFKNKIIPPLSSQAWQNSVEGVLSGIGCLAANIQCYASAYGDIAPCDFTPISFGNIHEQSLKRIWKSMINHPAYTHRSDFCRMQNPQFRHTYIDPIPEDAKLPYPIEKLPRVDYRSY
ncbi:MAG: radical SAM protein [Candidatus Lokiarchaeota archaeon]|nr:radical SAM protein [Candidatus Lokiarchaeota archaeon]